MNLESFIAGYVRTALWSSTDEHGEPLDAVFSADDIAPECMAAMRASCADFVSSNGVALAEYCKSRDASSAGHDFWLTRNGHGAGFWDRGLGKLGEQLTDAARVYSGVDLYVGDDGWIYGET